MKRKLLATFIVQLMIWGFSISSVKAQCGFSVTTSSTESRCKESGSITITPAPAGTYTYQITAGPITTLPTNSGTFSALRSGSYTLTITDGTCTLTRTVIVAGNYLDPGLLSATVKHIGCPEGTGCITANQPTNGRTPYSYALIAGPVTKPVQSSSVFCNLPAGQYTLQALDSCGVVRTTQYSVAVDTGNFTAYVLGYTLAYANCNDLVVCPIASFSNTTGSHSMLKIWYVTPAGDTLKFNNLEKIPIQCDTIANGINMQGTYQLLAYDSCGRLRTSTFTWAKPTVLGRTFAGYICGGGYNVFFTNPWKYALPVRYTITKCSDNSVVYDTIQQPPTTFYSPTYTLLQDTCYRITASNSCGDMLSNTFSVGAQPAFKINACTAPACGDVGKGSITLTHTNNSAIRPVVYKIVSGPEMVNTQWTQSGSTSHLTIKNLALGTYTIAAEDSCGKKDTITITVNKPLERTIEIIQTLNCSGGADVHVKITSNYYHCLLNPTGAGGITYITSTSPQRPATNVTSVTTTTTSPSVWEADYLNVPAGNFYLQWYSGSESCTRDTTITILPYIAPILSNITGKVCGGTGVINYTVTGGRAPYQFRIRPQGTATWGTWQTGTTFTGATAGTYDIEVRDVCPNGSISSFTFIDWVKSSITATPLCAQVGGTVTFRVNPVVPGVTYQWVFDSQVLSTDTVLIINNFQLVNNGMYTLRQTFGNGACVESVQRSVVQCSPLPISGLILSASLTGTKVQLVWKTFSEANTDFFSIEKSIYGNNFESIGTIPAAGNSNAMLTYNFWDNHPGSDPVLFYRIKAVDKDGKSAYSNIVPIRISFPETQVVVYPNPAKSSFRITGLFPGDVVVLSDASGRILYHKAVSGSVEEIDISKYATALFIVELFEKDGQRKYSGKLIKK